MSEERPPPGPGTARPGRRLVLKLAGAGAAAVAVGGVVHLVVFRDGDLPGVAPSGERLRTLTAREGALVEAIGARIWPGTPADPGAREAGTVFYVDRALAGPYANALASYRAALRQIDAACRQRFGAGFVELPEEKQDEALRDLSEGALAGVDYGREIFVLMRAHTLEGVFSDPMYGGNRGLVGWKAVGYPGPFFTISAEEQQRFAAHRGPTRGLRDL